MLVYRLLDGVRLVYAAALTAGFVLAAVLHLRALPGVLRRRTADRVVPWLLLLGFVGMAALRCAMIAFVEVSSFGIGTSTMYLATVHPLLLLYTFCAVVLYHKKETTR